MVERSFLVFSHDEETAIALRDLLTAIESVSVREVVWDESRLDLALKQVEAEEITLYADLGDSPQQTLDLLEALELPGGGFVVGGSREDGEVILRAFRMGAREFMDESPSIDDIAAIVKKMQGPPALADKAPSRDARIVAVLGAKGGVGSTVVTCQLAASLQGLGQRVAIIDLSYPLGDVAVHYDLHPRFTLSDVATASDQIDSLLVGSLLERHSGTGVEILAAPGRVQDSELVETAHVEAVIEELKKRFDWIVLDVSRSWGQVSIGAFDRADSIVLVTLQDVPALNHARAHRDILLKLGIPSSRIHTVVNRHAPDSAIEDSDISRFLGATADFALPNDYASVNTSVNEGRAVAQVAPNSDIDVAYTELARCCFEWTGQQPPEAARKNARFKLRNRIFSRFGKGS